MSRLFALFTALLLTASAAFGAGMQTNTPIAAQPLAEALKDFAAQTGLQVVYGSELARGVKSNGAAAGLPVAQALQELLKGTGLEYEFVAEKTVAIRASAVNAAAAADQRDASALLVSQSGRQVSAMQKTDNSSVTRSGELNSTSSNNQDELQEVIVTGTNIRGVDLQIAPVTVLDRKYIESTGLTTTNRLIESLPQNFALSNPAGVSVPGVSGPKTQGSSINLRGIGEGTTLVLLNGRRMAPGFVGSAVDIAALPLTAVERVEVLTDGASAVYGSDAVGGVVNFVLRQDYSGAQTRVQVGRARGGLEEARVSQIFGDAWETGNALISLEYYKRDLLPARERAFVPSTADIGSLYPRDKNYSAMFSGRQEITQRVTAFADALYSNRDSYNEAGRILTSDNYDTKNPQMTATLGLDWTLGGDWQLETAGSYANNKATNAARNTIDTAAGRGAGIAKNEFEIIDAQVKADGSVFSYAAGNVRLAVGAEWREESLRYSTRYESGLLVQDRSFDQDIGSLFAELHLPLIGDANAIPAVRRLELSLAARRDQYSDFGSSIDPRLGLLWQPTRGLIFRASHGTSFVAPKMSDYSLASNSASAFNAPDPLAPSVTLRLLQINGNDAAALAPQESKSSSFGVEWTPDALAQSRFGVNYYQIKYEDKIANPPTNALVVLGNPASYGSLFIRNPTVPQVNEAIATGQLGAGFFPNPGFSASSVNAIIDLRRRNLSVVETSGFDVFAQFAFDMGKSSFSLGLSGTYIFELKQQVTATSEPFEMVDTFYNPPDWRARANFGWRREGWAANLFVNHVDSYKDNRTAVLLPVSSYTTADARLAYDFGKSITVALNAQNLFDTDPPRTAIVSLSRDIGFDPTNANPIGRMISVEFVKTWR